MAPTKAQLQTWLAQRTRRELHMPQYQQAAVLVGLTCPRPQQPMRFLLTERSLLLPTHKGQISFAGGRKEQGETAIETALRETWEEVGLGAQHIEVLGALDDVYTPIGFHVTPILAFIPAEFDYQLSDEVQRLLLPTWDELAALAPLKTTQTATTVLPAGLGADLATDLTTDLTEAGTQLTLPVYRYLWQGHDIWGMTARILHDLLSFEDIERP